MSKIYDANGAKMNSKQVAEALAEIIPAGHINILSERAATFRSFMKSDKMIIAHTVLDGYKFLPADEPNGELSKKYLKYLLDRYMKSTTTDNSDEPAITALLDKICAGINEDGTDAKGEAEE